MLAGVSSARERSPTSEDTACYSGRMDQVEQVVARDSRIAYALVFGSTARGTATPDSDVDVAIGLQPGAAYSARDVGALIADLEHATGRRVDLVVADEAPPAVAYRIFRDGVPVLSATTNTSSPGRQRRFSTTSISVLSSRPRPAACWPPPLVVDRGGAPARLAAIRDAVERVREVRPPTLEAFLADRTAREVVTLNVFRAIQEAIAVATHWVSDEGWVVPQSHGEVFAALGDKSVIDRALADRLRAAAGLRNLIAHQYGVIDFERLYGIASSDIDDLLLFCQQIATRAPTS